MYPTHKIIIDTIVRTAATRGIRVDPFCGAPDNYNGHAFYSPEQWAERGEEYGHKALLIIVHEGSELAPWFSLDAAYQTGAASDYDQVETMCQALEAIGLYAEQCTTWYSAIYAIETATPEADEPVEGVTYRLTGGHDEPSVEAGNRWAESEVVRCAAAHVPGLPCGLCSTLAERAGGCDV